MKTTTNEQKNDNDEILQNKEGRWISESHQENLRIFEILSHLIKVKFSCTSKKRTVYLFLFIHKSYRVFYIRLTFVFSFKKRKFNSK